MNTKELTIFSLVIAAIFSRLIPHAPNFTAVGAVALFAGLHISKKYMALMVPLAAMLVTDLILGLHNTMVFVYLAFALITLLSARYLKAKPTVLAGASLATSLLFFVISNFGIWAVGSMYAKDISGLIACFTMALPFLSNQVLGDLFYVSVLFGAYELARRTVLAKAY